MSPAAVYARGQDGDSRPGTPTSGQAASPFKPVLKKASAVDLAEVEGKAPLLSFSALALQRQACRHLYSA